MFGVLLVALEDLQAGRQQVLELAVASGWDKRGLESLVHLPVESDLVLGIGLIERRS
jgi:hypothetical protein